MDFLKEKDIKDYNIKVKRIFNFLSIAGEYRVIGSASLKKVRYFSDYDLDGLFEDVKTPNETLYSKIYRSFKGKFIKARKDTNIFITDFKCGLNSDGEPLRWGYDDMMKGFKILENGDKMTFEECLNIKAMIKLDVIALINGIFTEFSENYFFHFGTNEGNFFPHDVEKGHILNNIKHSYDEYMYVEKNYMKALKRCFSYKELQNKVRYRSQLMKLLDFFNSPIGLMNKLRSELDIILVLLDDENDFRRPKRKDVMYNIQHIKEKANENGMNQFNDDLDKILQEKTDVKKTIEDLRNKILDFVNKESLDFIQRNKNLLLY